MPSSIPPGTNPQSQKRVTESWVVHPDGEDFQCPRSEHDLDYTGPTLTFSSLTKAINYATKQRYPEGSLITHVIESIEDDEDHKTWDLKFEEINPYEVRK